MFGRGRVPNRGGQVRPGPGVQEQARWLRVSVSGGAHNRPEPPVRGRERVRPAQGQGVPAELGVHQHGRLVPVRLQGRLPEVPPGGSDLHGRGRVQRDSGAVPPAVHKLLGLVPVRLRAGLQAGQRQPNLRRRGRVRRVQIQ
uniref:(northern house mosquito) hypothetical protein n=1 Tax=Culex pipiens TaxID=7175 RepID=A0A8D8BGV7_CULPI